MAVNTKVFQAGTHEAERFVFWPFFYLEDPVDCLLVKDIATDAVHGIGGVADDPPLPEKSGHFVKQALLGIVRIYGKNGHGGKVLSMDGGRYFTGTTRLKQWEMIRRSKPRP
jgi:hypothetical protein